MIFLYTCYGTYTFTFWNEQSLWLTSVIPTTLMQSWRACVLCLGLTWCSWPCGSTWVSSLWEQNKHTLSLVPKRKPHCISRTKLQKSLCLVEGNKTDRFIWVICVRMGPREDPVSNLTPIQKAHTGSQSGRGAHPLRVSRSPVCLFAVRAADL